MNYSQSYLSKKIVQYLQDRCDRAPEHEKDYRLQVIEDFKKSRGECVGYTVLWAYGRAVKDKSVDKDFKKAKAKSVDVAAKDGEGDFKKMLEIFASYDSKKEYSSQEESEMERFVSNLLYYQNPQKYDEEMQQNFLMQNVIDNKNYFSKWLQGKKCTCSQEMLELYFNRVIRRGAIVTVSFYFEGEEDFAHLVGFYQSNNGDIYYYDSNSFSAEIAVKNVKELAQKAWEASDSELFLRGVEIEHVVKRNLREISLAVFSNKELGGRRYDDSDEQIDIWPEEFCKIFSNQLIAKIAKRDHQIKSLIERLPQQQMVEIFELSEDWSTIAKKVIMQYLLDLDNEKISPQLIRSIEQNQGLLGEENLSEVKKKIADLKNDAFGSAQILSRIAQSLSLCDDHKSREQFCSLIEYFSFEDALKVLSKFSESEVRELVASQNILDKINNPKSEISAKDDIFAIFGKNSAIIGEKLTKKLTPKPNPSEIATKEPLKTLDAQDVKNI